MPLIDEVQIRVFAGSGGRGCISFRREKYVPYGGPNGGNGGRGGSVFLEATRDKTSLLDFKYQPKYEAERGEHGMGKEMDGAAGADLILKVPLGTQVYELNGLCLADLTRHGEQFLIAKGGKGGHGNRMFATSTNRAPRIATPGEAGEQRELRLELRVLADVGLVGLPNAGKSTFLRAISNARPKTAAYPFTTLEPVLGVAEHKDQLIVVADLPGLIEGASQGAGLGHRFLRHVLRNRLLLHLVEGWLPVETICKNVEIIRRELEQYDRSLLDRPQILLFTKMDLENETEQLQKKRALEEKGLHGFFVSSVSHEGLSPVLDHLAQLAPQWREATVMTENPPEQDPDAPQYQDAPL